MTYKEKYEQVLPNEELDPKAVCPGDFSFMNAPYLIPGFCYEQRCAECWEQEMPESAEAEEAKKAVKELFGIKDSGTTTEFETGAHRDSRENKGRCDLIPLEVAAYLFCHDSLTNDILEKIAAFMKSKDTAYLNTALMSFARQAYDNSLPTMMLEVSKHYDGGAARYGADNWKKGMPIYIYIDSALRHYFKWLRGDKDEPHDRAVVWNLMCCMWETDYHEDGMT